MKTIIPLLALSALLTACGPSGPYTQTVIKEEHKKEAAELWSKTYEAAINHGYLNSDARYTADQAVERVYGTVIVINGTATEQK